MKSSQLRNQHQREQDAKATAERTERTYRVEQRRIVIDGQELEVAVKVYPPSVRSEPETAHCLGAGICYQLGQHAGKRPPAGSQS